MSLINFIAASTVIAASRATSLLSSVSKGSVHSVIEAIHEREVAKSKIQNVLDIEISTTLVIALIVTTLLVISLQITIVMKLFNTEEKFVKESIKKRK